MDPPATSRSGTRVLVVTAAETARQPHPFLCIGRGSPQRCFREVVRLAHLQDRGRFGAHMAHQCHLLRPSQRRAGELYPSTRLGGHAYQRRMASYLPKCLVAVANALGCGRWFAPRRDPTCTCSAWATSGARRGRESRERCLRGWKTEKESGRGSGASRSHYFTPAKRLGTHTPKTWWPRWRYVNRVPT